jgi:hypothetical protein
MDVSCAFLNGELTEELYMELPEGYTPPSDGCEYVIRLKRGIYGLKQSPRAWWAKIDGTFRSLGFVPLWSEACVFVKKFDNGELCGVVLFVDDMIIGCANAVYRAHLKKTLQSLYVMEDLGPAEWFLNVRIQYDVVQGRLSLDQGRFLEKLLDEYDMQDVRPAYTPAIKDHNLPDSGVYSLSVPSPGPFKELIGSLLYLAMMTRPDILQAVVALSAHCHDAKLRHWTFAKHCLRYLSCHREYGLVYYRGDGEVKLTGYVDANYGCNALASCTCDPMEIILPSETHPHTTPITTACTNRVSVSGVVIFLAGGPVIYSSGKQKTVTHSSSAAEYIAAGKATKDMKWARTFLSELTFPIDAPSLIYEDNRGTIRMAENPCHHGRTRHLSICYHFIREHVRNGVVSFHYLPGSENVADLFTKALARTLFEKFRARLVSRVD